MLQSALLLFILVGGGECARLSAKRQGARLPEHTSGCHSGACTNTIKHPHVGPTYICMEMPHTQSHTQRLPTCIRTHIHTTICLSTQQQQHCSPTATGLFTTTHLTSMCACVCVCPLRYMCGGYFQTILCMFTTTNPLVGQWVCECIYLSERPCVW